MQSSMRFKHLLPSIIYSFPSMSWLNSYRAGKIITLNFFLKIITLNFSNIDH